MSGYFVHGGTQYAYGQSPQQTAGQSNLSSYQQPAQTTQFYQSTSYPTGQSSRGVLTGAAKTAVGSLYGSASYSPQTLGQNYSTQRSTPSQSYTTYDPSNTFIRQNSGNDNFNRTPYNTGTGYNPPSYGSIKQEDKYTSANTFGGFKANAAGNTSLGTSAFGGSSGTSAFFNQQTPSGFTTSYPSTTYNKPEEASSSQYSYEKALYVAANQYYLNKKAEAARGGARGAVGGGRGRGGRGRGGTARGGSQYQAASTGPKVIRATEVKAYLYAWCGQRRLKPEYTIEPMGMPPKMKFCCTLKISGLDYTAKVTAASKKDSQSKAAWDFCEHLVRNGFMKESDLPEKPVDPAPKSINPPKPSTPAGTEPGAAETIEESGGWTLENCRQRLNQFTQRWRIPAEFKHETHGPEHARTFIAELSVKIKWLDKVFHARERGNNKKQATAVCALAMIRQLYKEGLIEKQGDPIKLPNRRPANKETEKKQEQTSTAGTKRKADEENGMEDVDEYGNWKLEDGRQRLHMFCQATNQPFEIKYTPDGNQPPRMFTASVAVDVNINGGKTRLEKSHMCAGKKQAAQHCALEMIKELFQLSLVEPNIGLQQSKKKNPRQRNQMEGPMSLMDAPYGPPMYPPPGPMYSPFSGPLPPQRRTPYEDAIIFEKHRRIYPSDFELNLIQKTVRTIESALKQVSDELSELETKESTETTQIKQEPDAEEDEDNDQDKRILQGVMRVGALAKGLLLSSDLYAHLVLLSVEIPTASLLTKISSLLSKVLEESGDKYLIDLRISECCVNVTSTSETNEKGENHKCSVKVSLTSPLMRNLEPATGPADMLEREKCISSLAELRHAKWFQACASGLPSCVVLIRIFLDMKKRIPTWTPLSDWAVELIVEKALRTSFGQLSVGEGLRRVLSCLSSGVLLEDSNGLYDPCEKIPTDVIASMTPQEREDITESAHHALRMLVYRQTHKILGIEPMPSRVRRSTESEHSVDM